MTPPTDGPKGPIILGGMDGFCEKCRDYKTLVVVIRGEKYLCKECLDAK